MPNRYIKKRCSKRWVKNNLYPRRLSGVPPGQEQQIFLDLLISSLLVSLLKGTLDILAIILKIPRIRIMPEM